VVHELEPKSTEHRFIKWRTWPFVRHQPAAAEYRQVFRSLVQVNVYRSPPKDGR